MIDCECHILICFNKRQPCDCPVPAACFFCKIKFFAFNNSSNFICSWQSNDCLFHLNRFCSKNLCSEHCAFNPVKQASYVFCTDTLNVNRCSILAYQDINKPVIPVNNSIPGIIIFLCLLIFLGLLHRPAVQKHSRNLLSKLKFLRSITNMQFKLRNNAIIQNHSEIDILKSI